MKNRVLILGLCLLLLQNCSERKKESISSENKSKVDLALDRIKLYADSSATVYRVSIDYLKSHPGDSLYLKNNYQDKASRYYLGFVNEMENVTKIYMQREVLQDEYDVFIQKCKVHLGSFKTNVKELLDLGFEFKLDNPYLSKESVK